jgi:hypothetical protein
MSVGLDKGNVCLFGTKEIAICGHWLFAPFCLSSMDIPVLPAKDECPNTYPLMSKYAFFAAAQPIELTQLTMDCDFFLIPA